MKTQHIYNSIHNKNISFIRSGDVSLDPYLRNEAGDTRRGVSLLVSLKQIAREYEAFIEHFRVIEPDQYYYPIEDLHITIFDFVSAQSTYKKNEILEQTFTNITNDIIKNLNAFTVIFKGIVFSREAGLLKGFDDGSVVALRKRIRERIKEYGIRNDERYESETVHSTCIRFTRRIKNVERVLRELNHMGEKEIGKENVHGLTLVEHDWYNRKNTTRIIKEYIL